MPFDPARLKLARLEAGLTLEKAAEALGTDLNTIWRYEAGRHKPPGPTLHGLAGLYRRPVAWFFNEEDSEFPPLTPEEIEANRELVMSEPMLALRATRAELSDEAMADIADYIRFVHEREERRKRERQAGS